MEVQVPFSELQKRKIFLATPMYGGQCAGMYTRSVADLTALCTRHGIALQMHYLFNESLITRARNYCCDEFMRSDATHLMFIDSDIGFNPNDVISLLALSIHEPEKYDVIAGPYPKKCIAWEKIKLAVEKGAADKDPNNLEKFVGDYVFNPKVGSGNIPIGEPARVMEAGTGFMMISRRCLERYREAFPTLSYKPDHVRTAHFDGTREITAFFDCVIDRGYNYQDLHNLLQKAASSDDLTDIKATAQSLLELEKTASKRYLSEDYKFCYDVDKLGGGVWLCPWIELQHVGSYVFGGSLAALASIGAAATADSGLLNKIKNDGIEVIPNRAARRKDKKKRK